MGLNFLGSSVGNTTAPNPDPTNYRIIKGEDYGEFCIAEILYYGCTTFEGRKLLLLRCVTFDLVEKSPHWKFSDKPLDPHLLGGTHPVMARFEPTEEGWKLARLCAKELQ
jgi:hypothetical protein